MPFVNARILSALPFEAIWVVFEDVAVVGGITVAGLQKAGRL
jgi:hypothetical protein